jgi:hypothetical protein
MSATPESRMAATLVRLAAAGVGFHNTAQVHHGLSLAFRVARAARGASFFRGENVPAGGAGAAVNLDWHFDNPRTPMYVAVDLATADFYQCQYQVLPNGAGTGRVVEYETTRSLTLLDMSDPTTVMNVGLLMLIKAAVENVAVVPANPNPRATPVTNALAAVDELFMAFGLSDEYVTLFRSAAKTVPGVSAARLGRIIRPGYTCTVQAEEADNLAVFACNPDFPNHPDAPLSRMSFFDTDKAFVANLCRLDFGVDGYLALEMPTVDLEAVAGVFHAEMVVCSPESALRLKSIVGHHGASAAVDECQRRVATFLKQKKAAPAAARRPVARSASTRRRLLRRQDEDD